jgi:hypothetical protein
VTRCCILRPVRCVAIIYARTYICLYTHIQNSIIRHSPWPVLRTAAPPPSVESDEDARAALRAACAALRRPARSTRQTARTAAAAGRLASAPNASASAGSALRAADAAFPRRARARRSAATSRYYAPVGSLQHGAGQVVVSHDRTFLNEVCTDVVHLWSRKLAYYSGNYDTFEKANKQTNAAAPQSRPAPTSAAGLTRGASRLRRSLRRRTLSAKWGRPMASSLSGI